MDSLEASSSLLQPEHLTPDILTVVFSHVSNFRDLCNASLVCSSWRQVADAHPRWSSFCDEQIRRNTCLPKRVSQAKPTSPEPPSPAAAQAQPQQQGKPEFKDFWTQHVHMRCLEPLLGSAIVRKRSAAAWATYCAKEQQQGIPYPLAVKTLLSIDSIGRLALNLYPTNNYMELSGKVFRAPAALRLVGQHVMRLINENQGCCWWYVVFNQGQEDPPVYLCESFIFEGQPAASNASSPAEEHEEEREEDEDEEAPHDFILQSESFSQFWVDYLTEGLDWHRGNGCEYLEDEVRQELQGLHPWMLPSADDAAANASEEVDADENEKQEAVE